MLLAVTQVKMRELGVTTHSDYRVTLLMDHKSMVTVRTDKYGVQLYITLAGQQVNAEMSQWKCFTL